MMLNYLWLVPALPLAGSLILMLGYRRHTELTASCIGVGSVAAAAVVTLLVGIEYLQGGGETAYTQTLWTWMNIGGFSPKFTLYLDGLSLAMLGVVTGVGSFIHLFATGYMRGDEGFARFFAYMNLFVAAMLMLVLGDNLLVLYLGWEGVGLCSYLLVGFWYSDPANGRAARKAFIVTRVGDTAMALGLFLLYSRLGTLEIQELMHRAAASWQPGSTIAVMTGLLLLGGAVGKSAQLPLQTWLPDAMAGPTPVSALIHAATMVTAGVYLIARTHVIFELAPFAQQAVALVGALTLLLAGFTALVQTDIKRILAYSTMSQIGYMFLALGVGAWSAAIFHLMTHAFFKALLFLSAGSVILALHHEQDIFKMGGLRKQIPFTFGVFLVGSLALVAFPFTAGFASKDLILWQAWASGHTTIWAAGLFGAFLTAVYTFRLIFIVFFGEAKTHAHPAKGMNLWLPLLVLAIFSLIGGLIRLPLEHVLPAAKLLSDDPNDEHRLQMMSVATSVSGIFVAYLLFLRWPHAAASLVKAGPGRLLQRYWKSAWGFDWLYDRIFVRPYYWFARVNRNDVVDSLYTLLATGSRLGHRLLSQTQSGSMRWYAAGLVCGAVVVIAIALLVGAGGNHLFGN